MLKNVFVIQYFENLLKSLSSERPGHSPRQADQGDCATASAEKFPDGTTVA